MSDTSYTPAVVASLPQDWVAYITPFATMVGKSVDEVTAMLKPVVGEPGEQAISLLKDASASPDADIKAALNGLPSAVANRAIAGLRQVQQAAAAAMVPFAGAEILPTAPNDVSWLAALRAGGVLKVEQSTVIAAVRAALAHRVGLYEIPDLLVKRIEAFADGNSEQVPPEFFKLRKLLTRKNYGEIFEAIDGLDGNFVTEARKNALFSKIDANLWPAIISFFDQLKTWVEAWHQGAASPAMMMSAMMQLAGGGRGIMPPGMMQPPDTGVLRDHAAQFADEVNKVFSGTGVQVASALAYDATRIKEILENTQLPAFIGAVNREQMLRQLNVDVPATYPRLETNLTRFVLSIIKVEDQAAGDEELQFFGSLYMLGSQIPWDQLSMGKRAALIRSPR